MAISKKISELDVLTSPQDLTKLFPPLFAQDGSPLNIRMSMAEVLKSASQVVIGSGTLTGSSVPALSITQTWNNAATTFTGALINVTDTASNAASKLLDLQVGGSSKVNVTKDGNLNLTSGWMTVSASVSPYHYIYNDSSRFIGTSAANSIRIGSSGAVISTNSSNLAVSGKYQFMSTFDGAGGNVDIELNRDAADCLALRRSSNAAILRVYETYTDSTTFSRGVFGFRSGDASTNSTAAGTASTGVLRIGSEKGSVGGTAAAVSIVTDGTNRVTFAAAGGQTAADGHNMAFGTSTGTKIGTATGQKIGFWNATPVVQQVLATGAGATVDNVITLLQTLGLCKQS